MSELYPKPHESTDIRDILEGFQPEDLYNIIEDAKQEIYKKLNEIKMLNDAIAQAKDVLHGYGKDYKEMRMDKLIV